LQLFDLVTDGFFLEMKRVVTLSQRPHQKRKEKKRKKKKRKKRRKKKKKEQKKHLL